MKAASVPCGYMDELLGLDFSKFKNVELFGFDKDFNALEGAKKCIAEYKVWVPVHLEVLDAYDFCRWHANSFDLIVSNALNIYEKIPANEIKLYDNFYQSLKTGGHLILSFLTPPPSSDKKSPWKLKTGKNIELQQLFVNKILGVKWRNYSTETDMHQKLEKVGFTIKKHIF